jgi:LysR family transcriptional regulator, regulator for metE and metH
MSMDSSLEVRHLRLMQAIAEEGSVTAASRRLHLTQSALSHQLRDVELRLGVQLFLRVHRKMILTPAGDRLLRSAASVLGELERAENELRDLGRERSGLLRLATQCYTGYYWLPPLLEGFRAKHPGVEVRIVVSATERPLEALLAGEIDLAVCNSPVGDKRLAVKTLFRDELLVVVSGESGLAKKRHVVPGDFADENLFLYGTLEESLLYRKILAPAGIRPRSVSQVQLTEAMLQMVEAGLGIAVLAKWAVLPYLRRGTLRAVRLGVRGLNRKWLAVSVRRKHPPVYLADFIERLAKFRPAS